MPLDKIYNLINKKSGLFGLSGLSDLRDILLAAGYRVSGFKSSLKYSKQQKQSAKLALAIYIYDIRRYLASYMAMNKKLDAIVFTGTIGISSPVVRNMVMRGLNKPKNCKTIIAPQGEINNIAKKTLKCLKK
jgi:acetate kinase